MPILLRLSLCRETTYDIITYTTKELDGVDEYSGMLLNRFFQAFLNKEEKEMVSVIRKH